MKIYQLILHPNPSTPTPQPKRNEYNKGEEAFDTGHSKYKGKNLYATSG